jgi:hypothetical protein
VISFILFVVGVSNLPKTDSAKQTSSANQTTGSTKQTNTKKEQSKPEDLKELVAKNFDDGKVVINGDQLTIEFTGSTLSENSLVDLGIYTTKIGLAKIYKNDEFKKYPVVQFKVMGSFTDKYGNSSKDAAMSFTFDQSELQKVSNFNNLNDEQLVSLQGQHRTYLHPAISKDLKPATRQKLYPNN